MSGHGMTVGDRQFMSAYESAEARRDVMLGRVVSASELTVRFRNSSAPFSFEVLDRVVADLHEVELQAHEFAGSGVTL